MQGSKFCEEVDKNMTKEYNIFIDKRGIFMKYKLLLVGTNKIIINEFFQQLEGKFELQTSSLRYADLLSHIKYFNPEALVLCMSMEGQEQIDTLVSLKEELQRHPQAPQNMVKKSPLLPLLRKDTASLDGLLKAV